MLPSEHEPSFDKHHFELLKRFIWSILSFPQRPACIILEPCQKSDLNEDPGVFLLKTSFWQKFILDFSNCKYLKLEMKSGMRRLRPNDV